MSANVVQCSALDNFRSDWICGHLDYQRASDALEAAQEAAGQLCAGAGMDAEAGIDAERIRRAEQNVEDARRRLAEVESQLARHFNRFCGVGE